MLVKLDYDSVATYRGSVDGLEATSPSVTGDPLTGQSQAEAAYDDYVADVETAFLDDLAAVTPDALVGQSLRTVYGGVAVTIPADTVDEVLALDGVVAVQQDELLQPLTDSSPEFLGATDLYDALGTTAGAGRGVIYGNLDTRDLARAPVVRRPRPDLPPIPPTFSGIPRECNFGDNPLTPAVDPFVCNNKLIGGAALHRHLRRRGGGRPVRAARPATATVTAPTRRPRRPATPVDAVRCSASTAARSTGWLPARTSSSTRSAASQGCFGSDSAAAVGQAVLDGVNVINFSISGGTNPATDPVELAFLDAYAAGVFVATSAGNSGPGAIDGQPPVAVGDDGRGLDPDPRVRYHPRHHGRQRRHVQRRRGLDHRRGRTAAGRARLRTSPDTTRPTRRQRRARPTRRRHQCLRRARSSPASEAVKARV